MRTYNGIFSTASQSDKAYRYVLGMVRKVMPKMEELVLKESRSDQIDGNRLSRNEASNVCLGATSKEPSGIKKRDGGRGHHRYPSALEKNKKKEKKDNPPNLRCTELQFNANLSGYGIIYPQTCELTKTRSYGSATEFLNVVHALGQESTLLDSHINATPPNVTGL